MTSPPASRKPVIGLVGGIGAGKSAAAAQLAALGCARVDADAIGHDLLADADVARRIRERWGAAAFTPDGRVDRKALGSAVFADAAELAALNRILHPRIRREMSRQIAAALGDPDVPGVVVDAAVMLEAGWDDLCTHLVFVSAPAAARYERVARGRGWSRAEWKRREKSQISLDTKAARCDYTIDNHSSVSRLRQQIRRLFPRMCVDVR
jgi:dephospho-CoA kinase